VVVAAAVAVVVAVAVEMAGAALEVLLSAKVLKKLCHCGISDMHQAKTL